MNVAIYARVSRTEGQDTDNQLTQLRDYCQRQGWQVAKEYVDHATGKHADRDAFKQLFIDASQRQFDILLVWALDRLTREGVLETFEHIRRLSTYGVRFESFTEPHFRSTGPAGELMLAVAAWIAKQERQRISDRTKAGLQRARREGRTLGRPRVIVDRAKLRELSDNGYSLAQIAAEVHIPKSTVRRALQLADKGPLTALTTRNMMKPKGKRETK